MSDEATNGSGVYRAPFYVGANPANNPTTHEPDGQSGTVQTSTNVIGANTPDYPTLCLRCHGSPGGNTGGTGGAVSGTNPSRTVPEIPWYSGDSGYSTRAQHGRANAGGSTAGDRIAPYTTDGTSGTGEDTSTNFILSCTDCHEAHGSQQENGEYLLRTTVNGKTNITLGSGGGRWLNFCTACHELLTGGGGPPNHSTMASTTDCSTTNCHGHGGTSQNY
jgi:hypothetical protein